MPQLFFKYTICKMEKFSEILVAFSAHTVFKFFENFWHFNFGSARLWTSCFCGLSALRDSQMEALVTLEVVNWFLGGRVWHSLLI